MKDPVKSNVLTSEDMARRPAWRTPDAFATRRSIADEVESMIILILCCCNEDMNNTPCQCDEIEVQQKR